jgi:hypothetical protein
MIFWQEWGTSPLASTKLTQEARAGNLDFGKTADISVT